MSDLFDQYQLRARVQPALLCVVPPSLTIAIIVGGGRGAVAGAIGFATSAGVTYLMAHLVRDRGKRLEPQLWASWGGTPTTQLLRGHPDERAWVTDRRRALMAQLLPATNGAVDAQSHGSPSDAEIDVYVGHLRERTRDSTAFRLVAAENAGYGFRRNLFGLRWVGMALAGIAAVAALAAALLTIGHPTARAEAAGACCLGDIVVIVFWVTTVTSDWVRTQAFAYARALLDSAELLATGSAAIGPPSP